MGIPWISAAYPYKFTILGYVLGYVDMTASICFVEKYCYCDLGRYCDLLKCHPTPSASRTHCDKFGINDALANPCRLKNSKKPA